MTDKNTLDLARQWADGINAGVPVLAQAGHRAAADLISSLPDTIVDGDKLREVVDKWEGREITSDAHLLYREVEALLPAPPTMAEIEWRDAEHHLAEATAAWTEGYSTKVVMMNKFGRKINVYQPASHYPGLRELNPSILTPTGRKYRLEPEDDTHAEHGPYTRVEE